MPDQDLVTLLYKCWQAGAHYEHDRAAQKLDFPAWLAQHHISTEGVSKYLTCTSALCCRDSKSGLCMDAHCNYCDATAASIATKYHLDHCPGLNAT